MNSVWGQPDWGSDPQVRSLLRAFAVPERPVYPYSIVPGGIESADDLRRVVEHDEVVAHHYADFDFHHARIIELTEPRLVYLSYRIGSKVFWTSKKVTLHTGEKLITDGKITARTRCANQVAALPQNVLPPTEPPAELFEQPIGALPELAEGPYPVLSTGAGPGVPPSWGPVPVGGPVFPPIGVPPVCLPPKNGKPVPGKKPCIPYSPPPPGIPEPGMILLFLSGAAGVYLRLRYADGKA